MADHDDEAIATLLRELEAEITRQSDDLAPHKKHSLSRHLNALKRELSTDELAEVEGTVWAVPPPDDALASHLGDQTQSRSAERHSHIDPALRLMPRHEDTASAAFPSLGALAAKAGADTSSLGVCVVAPEAIDPTNTGAEREIALARALATMGHRVCLLRVAERPDYVTSPEPPPIEGVETVLLPPPPIPSRAGPMSHPVRHARAVYEWLKERRFDIVHAPDRAGTCFYAATAKHLGLAFADTLFVIGAIEPVLWRTANQARALTAEHMIYAYAERRSIELADIVVSPSQHMLRWMMRHGYDLPRERCFVHPEVHRPAPMRRQAEAELAPIRELVFPCHPTSEAGVDIFLRALDLVARERHDFQVSFLSADPGSRVFERAHPWPFEVKFIDTTSRNDVLDYLGGSGRLAVMPCLRGNAPMLASQCIAQTIPLIVSDRGGLPELVAEPDRADVVFSPVPSALAAHLIRILDQGVRAARPAVDPEQNLAILTGAHNALADRALRDRLVGPATRQTWNGIPAITRSAQDWPLVSVCIAHFNRPALLYHALDSIEAQTYPNIETIVVDDGSHQPAALEALEAIEARFAETGTGRVIRQPNRYLGAARNAGLRASRGAFALLMDDDNIAKPHEIETFLAAADHSGSDILCCFSDTFSGDGLPAESPAFPERITPLGDAVSLGLVMNCFGDSNCFVRQRVVSALGGFTEDYGVGRDDHEFFARAILRGFKLAVVPEALYWYRMSPVRLRDGHVSQESGPLRVLNAYLDNLPLCMHEILRFAQSATTAPRAAGNVSFPPAAREALGAALRQIDQLETLMRSRKG